jgi:HK97 family phage major capsid protein
MSLVTTGLSGQAWSPNVSVFAASDVLPESLILQTSTVSGAIDGDEPTVRVAFVDDAEADFTAEGDAIPESEPKLAEAVIKTSKVSVLVPLSREQFGQQGADQRISESVARAVARKANSAYLRQPIHVGDGWGAPAGILTHPDIYAGETITDSLDPIIDAFAAIQAELANPSHFLIDPIGWGKLRKLKTGADSRISILGAGTNDALPMLLNVPVIVTPAMPANSLAILDQSAIVSAVGQLQVAISEDFYFNRDAVAARCTWRFGAQLMRPERIACLNIEGSE